MEDAYEIARNPFEVNGLRPLSIRIWLELTGYPHESDRAYHVIRRAEYPALVEALSIFRCGELVVCGSGDNLARKFRNSAFVQDCAQGTGHEHFRQMSMNFLIRDDVHVSQCSFRAHKLCLILVGDSEPRACILQFPSQREPHAADSLNGDWATFERGAPRAIVVGEATLDAEVDAVRGLKRWVAASTGFFRGSGNPFGSKLHVRRVLLVEAGILCGNECAAENVHIGRIGGKNPLHLRRNRRAAVFGFSHNDRFCAAETSFRPRGFVGHSARETEDIGKSVVLR